MIHLIESLDYWISYFMEATVIVMMECKYYKIW